MIIDAHLHVWSDDYERYPFAEGVDIKKGAPVELLNETMEEVGVDKAVIVQPAALPFSKKYSPLPSMRPFLMSPRYFGAPSG